MSDPQNPWGKGGRYHPGWGGRAADIPVDAPPTNSRERYRLFVEQANASAPQLDVKGLPPALVDKESAKPGHFREIGASETDAEKILLGAHPAIPSYETWANDFPIAAFPSLEQYWITCNALGYNCGGHVQSRVYFEDALERNVGYADALAELLTVKDLAPVEELVARIYGGAAARASPDESSTVAFFSSAHVAWRSHYRLNGEYLWESKPGNSRYRMLHRLHDLDGPPDKLYDPSFYGKPVRFYGQSPTP